MLNKIISLIAPPVVMPADPATGLQRAAWQVVHGRPAPADLDAATGRAHVRVAVWRLSILVGWFVYLAAVAWLTRPL